MRTLHQRAQVLVLIALLVAVPGACSIAVSFSPEEDQRAMAILESTWSAGSQGYQLTLCEDRAAADKVAPDGCTLEHVVKGGGRSKAHSENRGGSNCAGCDYQAVAMVKGTLSGGGQASPLQVSGPVFFRDYNDPYAFPYQLELSCTGAKACTVTGTLAADGTLTIAVATGGAPTREILGQRTPATCP